MKDSESFRSDRFALLLVGQPKTGKTNIAIEFPEPGFLDCDDNLASAVRRHAGKRFKFSTIDVDDEGKKVDLEKRWPRLLSETVAVCKSPDVSTPVVDSLTKVHEYLCDYIVAQGGAGKTKDLVVGGERMMTQQMWYPYAVLMRRYLVALRNCGKNVIVTAHLRTDKDEVTGAMYYRPAISGQLADSLGGIFTDVWCCDTVQTPDGVRYQVRTAPRPQIALGRSLELPDDWVFSYAELAKRLQALKGV